LRTDVSDAYSGCSGDTREKAYLENGFTERKLRFRQAALAPTFRNHGKSQFSLGFLACGGFRHFSSFSESHGADTYSGVEPKGRARKMQLVCDRCDLGGAFRGTRAIYTLV
jgi:hypothetical protein